MQERADRWASTMRGARRGQRRAPRPRRLARHGGRAGRSRGAARSSSTSTLATSATTCRRRRAAGPDPRSPTSGGRASSATATASSTPRRSAAWPARRRSSCSPTTTSAPASPTPSRSPRSPRPSPGRSGSTSPSPRPSPSATTAGTVPAATPARTPCRRTSPGGYDHAVWGADVTLAPLNLCAETLDGIRNHSWSRPAPATPEGEVVSWADRIAYVCHDFEDAVAAGIVAADMLPPRSSPTAAGRRARASSGTFITAMVTAAAETGRIGMTEPSRRRARRVPPLQLRPRLPAAGEPGPGRRRHRPAAGARRALRRPSPPAARSAPGRRRLRRRGRRRRGLRRRDDRPLRLPPGRLAARLGPRQAARRRHLTATRCPAPRTPSGRARQPWMRHSVSDRSVRLSGRGSRQALGRFLADVDARHLGPWRAHAAPRHDSATSGSGPSNTASTRAVHAVGAPSRRRRGRRASRRHDSRNQTPCTRPRTTTR